jgi:hypothetical protein
VNDDEILTVLEEEIRTSIGFHGGELADQRKTALEYYYGQPYGNEVEGRSAYVSRDVADTIEWIMPSLMRIFAGGDTIVKFEPQGPEDDKSAQQATDYTNYVFNRQNDGFLTLYTWFKDALLSKNGFVKVYYEEYTEYKTHTYENLNDIELAFIVQDSEVLEHTGLPGEQGMIHSVKIRKKQESGKCCIEPVPPEEVLINRGAKAPLKKNRFWCHRRRVTIDELKRMGYQDVDDLPGEDEDTNEESIARRSFDETTGTESTTHIKYVWLSECHIDLDADGDGISERRTITTAGKRILENEEGDVSALVTLTPIILPHKLFGMSIADLVMDLQLLKSTVFRQLLDNMYLANNGRYMALDGMVNIDDLLTSRPGGIVRVKTFDAVKPMQPPLLGAGAFGLLEYIDTIKENRTGITKYNQGIDSDSLNKTATGINQIMSAAQQRTELIARIFAETGVKDLFYAILECVQKHQKKETLIRLRNEWVPMDPQEWANKFDMTVTVGLGTGSKDVLLAHMMEIIKLQMAYAGAGLPIIQPKNLYHSFQELLKAANIKGGDMFVTDPDQVQQGQQPNPEIAKAQIDAQTILQKEQLKSQTSLQKTLIQTQAKQQTHAMDKSLEDQHHQQDLQSEMMMGQREIMMDSMHRDMDRRAESVHRERDRGVDSMHRERDRQVDSSHRDRDRDTDSAHRNMDRNESEKPEKPESQSMQMSAIALGQVAEGNKQMMDVLAGFAQKSEQTNEAILQMAATLAQFAQAQEKMAEEMSRTKTKVVKRDKKGFIQEVVET